MCQLFSILTKLARELRDRLSLLLYFPGETTRLSTAMGDLRDHGYCEVKSLLTSEEKLSLVKALSDGPYFDSSDIRCIRPLRRISDNLRNRIYWYGYNDDILSSYDYVKYPPDTVFEVSAKVLNVLDSLLKQTFAVDTIELYRSRSDACKLFNSAWHVDGDCSSSVRCMIYLSDVSTISEGPLQFKTNHSGVYTFLGESGDACFFRNSIILHRGASTEKDRLCLNIKFRPALRRTSMKRTCRYVNYQGALL